MRCRFASPDDAEALARLNAHLIRDEGHRNPMTIDELAERMRDWLCAEYQAVLIEARDELIGYALFRRQPEFVYLRQLFVRREFRRSGIGREAVEWLQRNVLKSGERLRVEVLVGNVGAQAFWRAVGFRDYCLTLEQE